MNTLYRIVGPSFVAGLEANSVGRIVNSAPILYRFKWLKIEEVINQCCKRGWTIDPVNRRP